MTALRVALHTLGCRVNQADTIALADELRSRSAVLVGPRDVADVYVLNTCTVTHAADADARKIARRMKRQNPAGRVVVTGCYAQVAAEALRAVPEVDLVLGNDKKHLLADAVLGIHSPRATAAVAEDVAEDVVEDDQTTTPDAAARGRRRMGRDWTPLVRPPRSHITALPETHTRPFLKVQDGCDYTCAFCIIPKARGVSRSIAVDDVARQAARYAELGATELVLTGIHLGHWGRDMTPRRPLHALVQDLADRLLADGAVRRLRLGSVEPNEVTSDLIALLVEHPLLTPHLHVPLQSGDDDVLKRMRRLYSTDTYAQVIEALRRALPDAAIGADVLVGHPGEDDTSFARTLAFLDALDWSYLHVFPFSARRGTPSAVMSDQITSHTKAERVTTLIRRSDVRRHLFHRRFLGQEREWLVMKPNREGFHGLSDNYIPATITSDRPIRTGDIVRGIAHTAAADRVQVHV